MAPELPARVRLSRSGLTATLEHDSITESGVVLTIGAAEQSHVEAQDPAFLLHDYLRRMRSVLTALEASRGQSARTALHLGAGAMTLPRWLLVTWPGIEQTVVDYEPELVAFVLEHLPMAPPPRSIVADAAEALSTSLRDAQFELLVIDLFNSAQAPPHLTEPAFFRQALAAVRSPGTLLMNFGDDADLTFARRLVASVLAAADGCSSRMLLSAPHEVMSGSAEGNLMLAVDSAGFADAEVRRIRAAGPHPGDALSGQELEQWLDDEDVCATRT